MIKGFKDFITGGNLLETAVALVMALAVVDLVNSLIANIITPIIGAILGEPDFSSLSFTINDSVFTYGSFINALITFVSIGAAVYFFIVVPYNRYKRMRGISPETKTCPECLSDIPAGASRCAHCGQPQPATA
ncbi:MAG TPA: MscL family protein [Solirubrobacterales bacterium]|jgi:large conductance mechanosensitive channel